MMKLNQKGQLTIDFLFSLVLVMSVSAILAALTFALTLAEVVQYVSYAGARAYFAADINEENQQAAGNAKANNLLMTLPFLTGAQKAGWIVLPANARGADNFDQYREQIGASETQMSFVGYQIQVQFPVLGLKLPFLADAIQPPEGSTSFGATVSSFLLREPSFMECRELFSEIFSQLKSREPSFYGRDSSPPFIILDNGC